MSTTKNLGLSITTFLGIFLSSTILIAQHQVGGAPGAGGEGLFPADHPCARYFNGTSSPFALSSSRNDHQRPLTREDFLKFGRGLVFPVTGTLDFSTGLYQNPIPYSELEIVDQYEVCLTDLGTYDNEGNYVGTNEGKLRGKYVSPILEIYLPPFYGDPVSPNNDFRYVAIGQEGLTPRQSHMYAAAVNSYFHFTNFRRTVANDEFFASLNLDPEIYKNVTKRQYRPDLVGLQPGAGPMKLVLAESLSVSGMQLYQTENRYLLANQIVSPETGNTIWGLSYEVGASVGDYPGLMITWITKTNDTWPLNESLFNQNTKWISNALPALNDGISQWTDFVYTGQTEANRYAYHMFRRVYQVDCGTTPNGDFLMIPCDKGYSIINGMHFDETVTSGWNRTFPFKTPLNYDGYSGPGGSDLSAYYVAAIFHDLAFKAGLGIYQANRIAWKTISLVDDMDKMPMRRIGQLIQQAARELFPLNGDTSVSVYEEQIRDILLGRGIAVDAKLYCTQTNNAPGCCTNTADPLCVALGAPLSQAEYYLPPPIGEEFDFVLGDGTPTPGPIAEQVRFGSSIPESHPSSDGWGIAFYRARGYTAPASQDSNYVAYQFIRHTEYGPCGDYLAITDGTFSGSDPMGWTYNNDGQFYQEFYGKDLENTILFFPKGTLTYNRVRKRCDNELEGTNPEDIATFGFRVIKEIQNGFSFTVQRMNETERNITYALHVMDPSQAPHDKYEWEIVAYSNTNNVASKKTLKLRGDTVSVVLNKDQPVDIKLIRKRGDLVEDIEIMDRVNDLDRNDGSQFAYWMMD